MAKQSKKPVHRLSDWPRLMGEADRAKKAAYTPPPAPSPCPGIFVPGLPKAGVK